MVKDSYDFGEFINTFETMRQIGTVTDPSELQTLKFELNKFFNDCNCREVIYTNNTDNMLFGCKAYPILDTDNIYEYLLGNEPMRATEYVVEIDSKLLNPVLNLTARELTIIFIHEVWHVVGNPNPIDEARNVVGNYLAVNKKYLKISDSIHYKEILAYGLKDYISKYESLFYEERDEILADEFATMYDFADDLISAHDKIYMDNMKMYENSQLGIEITLVWVLGLYHSLKTRRITACKTLGRAMTLTGSRIEKMEIENVIKRIKRIDDDTILESNILHEDMNAIKAKLREKMRKSRLNNLRTIENTYYELAMQVKNVEDEDDALYLMRQINNSISIMEEYAASEDCDEYEREQWRKCLSKFYALRDSLLKATTYKNKSYGLFVQYPDIVENRY